MYFFKLKHLHQLLLFLEIIQLRNNYYCLNGNNKNNKITNTIIIIIYCNILMYSNFYKKQTETVNLFVILNKTAATIIVIITQ